MYRAYKRKQMRKKKNIVVGLTILILAMVMIKVVYGNLLGTSSAYTTLENSEISTTQSQTMQPKMDIKAIQTSLDDVLKQYQDVIESTNKANKATLVSEVDKLYSTAANDNTTSKRWTK